MLLNNIDLNKLKSFYYFYLERSLLRSSEKINVSPSAVSQSLRALEKELGRQLFISTGKKGIPTLFADELFKIAQPFFIELDGKLSEWNLKEKEMSGKLTIGCPIDFGAYNLLKITTKFQKKYPDVDFRLIFADTKDLLKKVSTQEVDIAVTDQIPNEIDFRQLSFLPIYREELVMAVSKDYYEKYVKSEKLADLLKLNYIPYNDSKEAVYKWFRFHFKKIPQYRYKTTIDNSRAQVLAIQDGLGAGVVPLQYIKREVDIGSLKIIRESKASLINTMCISQLKNKIPSKLERVFSNHIREYLA